MPIYEYRSASDGAVIELLRPMSQADAPVPDPEGKGRVFTRVVSGFATSGGESAAKGASRPLGPCCPCGKSPGSCSSR